METVKNIPINAVTHYKIYIVGERRFLNETLSNAISEKTGAKCHTSEDINAISRKSEVDGKQQELFLFDFHGKTISDFTNDDVSDIKKIALKNYVALINVQNNLDMDNNCMRYGIRGIFYDQDGFEIFMKGIEAICKGELWFSRKAMSRAIQRGMGVDVFDSETRNSLTHREIEILSLVSVGSKNEEIADKLFVSPHTIKTHLYNIYKKLNVANRLQATLWATKNL